MDGDPTSRDSQQCAGRGRGVLYPARLPTFRRVSSPPAVADLVRWFWIPEWDLPDGRASRQHLIAFPALNLVVERGDLAPPDMVGLSGPTTRASYRDLTGRGWAVGALLRPAAVPLFTKDPLALVDQYLALALPELRNPVVKAMCGQGPAQQRHSRSVDAFTTWLADRGPAPDEEALLANRLADVIDLDREVLRVQDAAVQVGVSVRTVQRLARRYLGVSVGALIRRRRLQEAAERLRFDATLDIATLAAELDYSDHAHLTRDFRTTLGITPSRYRGDAAG
ncbi:helix-turn-helix domain-containing protein [Rhodococcus sp. H29-C3]|uniref:AraC family transcriptional regulator n=1 Tax=Rhodococcus sp. H29-C3 TaxID=3046307 RepID=UPI0024B8C63C|nr:helix-turn-helix domain-containing protein [Rhodococcus sp. H29-C3]MDJ0363457.1 helix-turn-helix domain-containing protein [Rhodococcus sp. H29-C3]